MDRPLPSLIAGGPRSESRFFVRFRAPTASDHPNRPSRRFDERAFGGRLECGVIRAHGGRAPRGMESAAIGFGLLLPDRRALSWSQVHVVSECVTITLKTSSPLGRCPLCRQPSSRVHSRYRRKLAELPWHATAVRLVLRPRRFFCDTAACPRKIFAERLPGVAVAHAERTCRLSQALEHLGFARGGEGGARVARLLGMPVSPIPVLRRLARGDRLQRRIRHPPPVLEYPIR